MIIDYLRSPKHTLLPEALLPEAKLACHTAHKEESIRKQKIHFYFPSCAGVRSRYKLHHMHAEPESFGTPARLAPVSKFGWCLNEFTR